MRGLVHIHRAYNYQVARQAETVIFQSVVDRFVCFGVGDVQIAVQLVGIFAEDVRFNERLACDGAVGKELAALKYA